MPVADIIGLVIAAQAAPAEPPAATAPLDPISDRELAEMRGGFSLSDVEIRFGVEIRTYLEGELVLQTNVSWDGASGSRSEFASSALSSPNAAELRAGLVNGGGISMRIGDRAVHFANDGRTLLAHRVDGSLQNVLINTANNVSARQEIDATFDIHNAAAFSHEISVSQLGDALNSTVADGLSDSLSF